MSPKRLSFLNKFNKFYQTLANDVKKERYDEQKFYLITGARAKALDQRRRERKNILKGDFK